ncbi:MAG: sigma-70 family RNA polymerase sigma factor [Myxococcales bacterium]|nr:sigma-70 family RNA polymerase sigma factor [Myxococcales bacterium]
MGGEAVMEPDDEVLVQRARSGERAAFHALVRRHQARAIAFAARYLGASAPANDAAQEAFVDLYLSLPRYRSQDRFRAYWHRLLLNRCRMNLRAGRSRETMLMAREREQAVQRSLESLSEKLRVVIALRFTAGLPLQDIADTLELPLGTVKSRLFSGLRRFFANRRSPRTHRE